MPTVLRMGPNRIFFYAGDRNEPPHVHVEHDDSLAKFWLVRFAFKKIKASGGTNLTKLKN
jgi:hypothetical protein